jgi:hypothetical protein
VKIVVGIAGKFKEEIMKLDPSKIPVITVDQLIEEMLSCMVTIESKEAKDEGTLIVELKPREGMCPDEAIRLGAFYLGITGESFNLWHNLYNGEQTAERREKLISAIMNGEWHFSTPHRATDTWRRIVRAGEKASIEVIDWY